MCMYFLNEVKNHSIPYSEFNKIAGYKENYIIDRFYILDEDCSAKLIEAFGLTSELHL